MKLKSKAFNVFILLIIFLGLGNTLQAKSILKPTDLKVEYLTSPYGVDFIKPRFSWILESTKAGQFAQKQQAYRILVASTEKGLKGNKGDVWDSGWKNSAQMSQISFEGTPLSSDRTYYWKVAIKDQNAEESVWSNTTSWTTGLLKPKEWQGKWIGGNEAFQNEGGNNTIWDPWFRKTFDLKQVAKQANFYLASLGYHELYVNGQRVGNEVLGPNVTDHTKRARYVVYNIAPYLKKGKNVIAVWLGTSWSIFPGYDVDGSRPLLPMLSGQVKFYSKLNPNTQENPLLTLITDASWKTKNSPNKLLGLWDFGQMGGELWDDRKREDDWNTISYNDQDWKSVNEYNLNLKFSAQNAQGTSVKDEIKPVSIEERADGSFRVDMGVNFAGWTSVKVKGNEGDKIEFLYSEREKDDKTFNLHSAFIIGKSGVGEFKNRFNYSSGRWITIKGLKEKPQLSDIKGWLLRTDFNEASTFESSSELQNWMYDRIKWTFENLSIGGFIVDCPQRERMGYGGDAHATSETGMLNYQLGAFYSKWMQDWRDVQGTEPMVGNMRDKNYARKQMTSGRIMNNGILPHTAPTYWGGGGPSWGGIVVTLPYFMYNYYGDTQVLHENYELIKNWLAFLDSNVENDLMKRFGGTWDYLGDWLWPNATAEGMNNNKPETLCLNNSYRVFNLRTAAKIATLIGDHQQAKVWLEKADRSSKAIHAKFYNKDKANYVDGSMANLAAALLADVMPASEKERIIKALEHEILVTRKGHIHAGITGGALLFRWLRENNRNDLIYSMTSQTTYPSWGYMKENDATTIWEMWEKDLPGHSLLHSSYLYPGAWLIDGLGGIKIADPGFTKFVIQPPLKQQTNLSWTKASFDSPVGKITSDWKRTGDKLELHIVVPANSTAILKIGSQDQIDISKYQQYIKELPSEGNNKVYSLESGEYTL